MAQPGTVTGGVLVGMDGSNASTRALQFAIERYGDDPITALYVIDPYEADHRGLLPPLLGYWGDWYERATDRADRTLERAETLGRRLDVDVTPVREHGRVDRVIEAYVREHDVEHVLVGAHGRRDLAHAILGDVASRVARRASVPVTVVR